MAETLLIFISCVSLRVHIKTYIVMGSGHDQYNMFIEKNFTTTTTVFRDPLLHVCIPLGVTLSLGYHTIPDDSTVGRFQQNWKSSFHRAGKYQAVLVCINCLKARSELAIEDNHFCTLITQRYLRYYQNLTSGRLVVFFKAVSK